MTKLNLLLRIKDHIKSRQKPDYSLRKMKKILIADNKKISDEEYAVAVKICDILTAISEVTGNEMVSPPQGGVFWENARHGKGPYGLHLRKNRKEIDHSFLFNTRFRDFPTISYEYNDYTPKPDFWVRKYIRLSRVMPEKWKVKIPAQFGEIGWNVEGYPVNRLTAVNQERINVMYYSGILGWLEKILNPKILEIGSGGGELGYVFCKALPNCLWINCDLLACIAYSAIHLAIMLPARKHYIYIGNLSVPVNEHENMLIRSPEKVTELKCAIVHIPHFLLEDFTENLQINLAYNTYSFGEMPTSSVSQYAVLLEKFLRKNGVLFEQNGFFSEKNTKSVREILSNHFKEINWDILVDNANRVKTAAIHLWYNNNIDSELKKIATQVDSEALLGSLLDYDDTEDIEFFLDAWGKFKLICPYGI